MKYKKLFTMAIASVMAFSSIMLSGCIAYDRENVFPNGEEGSPVLSNEFLLYKIFAYYPLERSGMAIHPFTAKSLPEEYDLQWAEKSASAFTEGRKGDGLLSGKGIFLPEYREVLSEESGFSLSFTMRVDSEYAADGIFISSDYMKMQYGALALPAAAPEDADEIGVGAYGEEDLVCAREEGLSEFQLSIPRDNEYYDKRTFSQRVSEEWRFVTLSVNREEVCFYLDGALAYRYGKEILGDRGKFFLQSVIDRDGGEDDFVSCFTDEAGVIDDLLIGRALTAAEVLALYNNFMGEEKSADDAFLDVNADDVIRYEADRLALQKVYSNRNKVLKKLREDFWEEEEKKENKRYLGNTEITSFWWTQFAHFKPLTGKNHSFEGVVKFVHFCDSEKDKYGTSVVVYSEKGTECVFRMDSFGWKGEEGGENFSYLERNNIDKDTFARTNNFSYVTCTVKSDGKSQVLIRFDFIPCDAGTGYEGKYRTTLSDGSIYEAKAFYRVPESYFVEYTVTGLSSFKGITFDLTVERSLDIFTSVSGVVLSGIDP